MKTYSQELLMEIGTRLDAIHAATSIPILYSEQALKLLLPSLEQLKNFFLSHDFASQEDEIAFFKHIKPQFVYRLIYYNEVYNIEMGKPQGGEKAIRKFLNMELAKLQQFYAANQSFYTYYRMGSTYLDSFYFLRSEPDISFTLDSAYFHADPRFSTPHDYKTARIMANDLLQQYLESELQRLDGRAVTVEKTDPHQLQWTSSKVSLVELIYALHSEGAFNQGTADLKEVASFFESIFRIELGQYHRAYIEMRLRKNDRTKFLNSLRERLLRRMEDADG